MKGIGLTLFLGLAACAGSGAKAPESAASNDPHPARLAAQPWDHEPCTRTSEIMIDGAVVGYLVEYRPVPVGMLVERALPTGSYRIEGPRFEEIGFVTPRGEVRRYVAGGSESLGVWRLEEGLRRFFGRTTRVQLRELEPAAPPKAAPPDKGDKAEGDKGEGDKGNAKKEGEAGGAKKQDAPSGH